MRKVKAAVTVAVSAVIVLLDPSLVAAGRPQGERPMNHNHGVRNHVLRQESSASPKPPKNRFPKRPSATTQRYLLSGIFLTDLSGRTARSYSVAVPEVARKYPGVDLLVTVIAEGKVILPPRAVRLKLPPMAEMPSGAFLNTFSFSRDGTHIATLMRHGSAIDGAYSMYQDLCVVNPADGQVRRLTKDRFFQGGLFSPNHRYLAAVEQMDVPPAPFTPSHIHLVAIDTKTKVSQTLFERKAEATGIIDSISWTTSKAGEQGVVFRVRDAKVPVGTIPNGMSEKEEVTSWYFARVPAQDDTEPRKLSYSDLPSYSVHVFPPAVVKAQRKLGYERVYPPRSDMAVFYRDDSYTQSVSNPSPEWQNNPWIDVTAGRRSVIDAAGKTLLNSSINELTAPVDWTWDGQLLIAENDMHKQRRYLAINPHTSQMRRAIIPLQVPYPWEQWMQLSPAAARRAATQWHPQPDK